MRLALASNIEINSTYLAMLLILSFTKIAIFLFSDITIIHFQLSGLRCLAIFLEYA